MAEKKTFRSVMVVNVTIEARSASEAESIARGVRDTLRRVWVDAHVFDSDVRMSRWRILKTLLVRKITNKITNKKPKPAVPSPYTGDNCY